MKNLRLSVVLLERILSSGGTESLKFYDGVNVLVGVPNTGKTKWLQTLDYLLGDTGENPFASESEKALSEKYDAAAVTLKIGEQEYRVERKWREAGMKSKVLVDGEAMPTKDFQHWLMSLLEIPILHYPKGNPMSGQTWPELSFRSLLRHMYRQQRFWSDLVDMQQDAEFLACVHQFVGLGDKIYTEEYGNLVKLIREAEKLEARKDQYSATLNELARDLLNNESLSVSVTPASIEVARSALQKRSNELGSNRNSILQDTQKSAISDDKQIRVLQLAESRANLLQELEKAKSSLKGIEDRLISVRRLKNTLVEEMNRIIRAEDAGSILSDLRITHCPACDQPVTLKHLDPKSCSLCHQHTSDLSLSPTIGKERLKFERERLGAEVKEANELILATENEYSSLSRMEKDLLETIKNTESELEPARSAIGALAQEHISQIDLELGQINERLIQIDRVENAADVDKVLNDQIRKLQDQIEPLRDKVNLERKLVDFGQGASWLEDGMNDYLNAINSLKPNSWKHSSIGVYLSKSTFTLRVGSKRWKSALGGTDTLYVLMAYQYALLTLVTHDKSNFPGLVIIDTPAEFVGEALGNAQNFVVQPFIDLLEEVGGRVGQVIVTGAAFDGLEKANVKQLTKVHVS